jgi:Rieske Fe-S protein
MEDRTIARRNFIRTCCNAAVGVPLAATVLSSCSGTHFATATIEQGRMRVALSEFSEQKEGANHKRQFVLVQTEASEFPICVHRQGEGQFSAALLSCTHNVCELNVTGPLFVCPCHGSEFTLDGAVVKGPAEENLTTFKTTVDDGFVWVEQR